MSYKCYTRRDGIGEIGNRVEENNGTKGEPPKRERLANAILIFGGGVDSPKPSLHKMTAVA